MWRTKRAILKRALADVHGGRAAVGVSVYRGGAMLLPAMWLRALAGALCFALLFWGPPAALFGAHAEAPEAGAARRFAIELMEHINAARAKVGVQPLTLDFALCQPAQARAEECLVADMRTQEGAHTRPDGSAFDTVLDAFGCAPFSIARENLAYTSDLSLSAARVFQSWMESDIGHREAMLDPAITTMGAGVFRAPQGATVAGVYFPDGCLFLCLLLTDGTPEEPYIPQGSPDSPALKFLRRPVLPIRRGCGLYPSFR